jgi:pimeloyl-ACP methyl ester carboxylesterase
MRPGRIQLDGGTLETAWWGPGPAEAPTIILLHEGLGCIALWRDVPKRLAEATGWGVFAYSRFGYGDSDATPLPRPMTYMHDEAQTVLAQVLRTAGIQRSVLLGHSDGGSIAAIYAGHKPDPGLLGLVTIAAHFIVEELNLDSIRRIKAEYDTGTLRPRLARYHRNVDTAFRGWNDAWLDPRFRDFDITGSLPNIEVPILALQGAVDPYGTDKQLHVFQASVSAPITVQLIDDAKHSPHLEAADKTLAAITSFIATLPLGAET